MEGLEGVLEDPLRNAAYGAVLGACVGDSVGSYLEFSRNVTPEKVDKAMGMPGGGHHGISPGQVTDDGEMTVSLATGLVKSLEGKVTIEAIEHAVGREYARWLASPPFDIGRTTRAAIAGGAKKMRE
eukprot:Sspe_Gene.117674::Locus_109269_Transcript_1_1_Confidence_1.000_Length_427::g.117674::m.117674